MPIDAIPVGTVEASVEVVVVPSGALATPATESSARPRYRKPRPLQYWGSITVLVVMVLLCFVGPHVLHLPGPNALDYTATSKGFFTKGHLLGTDELGRDLLSRCLWGGQISI